MGPISPIHPTFHDGEQDNLTPLHAAASWLSHVHLQDPQAQRAIDRDRDEIIHAHDDELARVMASRRHAAQTGSVRASQLKFPEPPTPN